MKYKDMTTDQLRGLMRERGIGPDVAKGTWIVHCPKSVAVAALLAKDNGQEFDYSVGRVKSVKPDLPKLPEPAGELPPLPKPQSTDPDVESVIKAVKDLAGGRVNEGQIKRIAREELDEQFNALLTKVRNKISDEVAVASGIKMTVQVRDLPEVELDRQHYQFKLLLACGSVDQHMMLVGPAGSGKTTVAASVAESLGRPFEAISFGPTTSKADLMGYKDANGNYHDTGLVRAYRDGGVFLGDEMDAANAGVLTQVNMALSNGHMSTPVGMLKRHKNFLFIAGCNTYGVGANRQYVGRNQLDAATLDRFAVIEFPIDEGLEAYACGISKRSPQLNLAKGGVPSNTEWLDRVHKVRDAVTKLEVRHIVSPRASIGGTKLIAAGVGLAHLDDLILFKGMDAATRKKVAAECAI